jgi:predicted enzyme related to lactoylglutathione lyase
MITQSMFVIAVPDLQRTAAFFRSVLAFKIHESEEPDWRIFVNGSCTIMAAERPSAPPPVSLGDHAYFAYLLVDKVDAYYRRALDARVEIFKDLTNEPCAIREFGLRTPDGHRLMIGQQLSR